MQNISDIIRRERESRRMTQTQMAEQLNIAQSAYNRIEKGDTDITLKRLAEIARILDVDIEYLIKNLNTSSRSENTSPNTTEANDELFQIKYNVLKEQLLQLLKAYALPYIHHRLVKGTDIDTATIRNELLKKLPYISTLRILLQHSILSKKDLQRAVDEHLEWLSQADTIK
uniref:Helix-turn-helix transcriptional regulator n=1 Tax=Roseihalotalea indica TaxID=2867963 RepID=A0AA49JKF1_9BACT|nr:helix-turn-helix transcriptional regulator [Tunicatimonas sp. TK19036]